jgi:hypothetical protein
MWDLCPFEAIVFLDDAEYAKMIAAEKADS